MGSKAEHYHFNNPNPRRNPPFWPVDSGQRDRNHDTGTTVHSVVPPGVPLFTQWLCLRGARPGTCVHSQEGASGSRDPRVHPPLLPTPLPTLPSGVRGSEVGDRLSSYSNVHKLHPRISATGELQSGGKHPLTTHYWNRHSRGVRVNPNPNPKP